MPEAIDVALNVTLDAHLEELERPAFTAIHVALSEEEEPQAPDEETTDKILFIVNNLAPSNFDTKVTEMADRMDPLHYAWFAHYIVAQRVSIEPNNHQLYLKFLDALSMPLLIKRVLYETFVKLATLLNSEKTVQSSTERTLLKNLGSWLGGLTLAKNKPIKQQNIAFKDLLIQGFDSNRLIVAIPFVCKVLEQCSKSRVFKPPNPWLMAILRLLVELYQFAELKLNLKFEIEVLCKSLNIDLKDVEPTDLLRNRPKEIVPVETSVGLGSAEAEERAAAAGRGFAQAQGAEQGRTQLPGSVLGTQAGYSLSLQGQLAATSVFELDTELFGMDRYDLSSSAESPVSDHLQPSASTLRQQQYAQETSPRRRRSSSSRNYRPRRRTIRHHRRHLDSRIDDEGLCDGGRRREDGNGGSFDGSESSG